MRAFIYNAQTTSDAIKLAGENVMVKFSFTSASSLICYVQAGITPDAMAEITDSNGVNITRFTASGTDTQIVNISGLTPGSYVGIGTVSGTGTVVADFITGAQ